MSALRSTPPTFEHEIALAASLGASGPVVIAGIDEVGRGAIAGPVAVGACAVVIAEGQVLTDLPADVRDSKLLSARRREDLADPIRRSAHASAVGWASAREIDAHGILSALALAARRAVDALAVDVHAVLLDGNVDVFASDPGVSAVPAPRVALRVKADRDCRSVAAASVLAKVARDQHMCQFGEEARPYGWESNKGYGSAVHRQAITELGTHPQHRVSWNLTGRGDQQLPGVLWDTDRTGRARQQEGCE